MVKILLLYDIKFDTHILNNVFPFIRNAAVCDNCIDGIERCNKSRTYQSKLAGVCYENCGKRRALAAFFVRTS